MVMVQERQTKVVDYRNSLNGERFPVTVKHKNEEAELGDSAFRKKPVKSEQVDYYIDTNSLSHAPNLHKHKEPYVSKNFIQLNRTEETFNLLANDHKSFLLLSYISLRATRNFDEVRGLEPGECFISELTTPKECGLTPKEFRNAKTRLKKMNLIKEVYNPTWKKGRTNPELEKYEKRASKRASKSCIVKLCNTGIYDINDVIKGEQKGEQRASKGRAKGDIQEDNKENKENNNITSKTPSKKSVAYAPSPFATSLLTDFHSLLFSCIPDFPKEKIKKTKTQYKAAERLLSKNTHAEIMEVASYALKGWWVKHVHSMTYLESKFLKLQMMMQEEKKKPKPKESRFNNPSFAPKEKQKPIFPTKLSFANNPEGELS